MRSTDNLPSEYLKVRDIRRAPVSSILLYWISIILIPVTLLLPGYFFLLSVLCMIVVNYGGHEAVHGCLTPRIRHGKLFNLISGVFGYAMLGHNFIFLRWSHLAHHRHGRDSESYTIDTKDEIGTPFKTIRYYVSLLGASCIYHELAGYIYPIVGDKYHILSRRFKRHLYYNSTYVIIQFTVFLFTILLFYIGGVKYLICKTLFTFYWGLSQNVAHYGLDIGRYEHSEIASRTYRLSPVIEFLIFRGGAYHLEHHVFPNIPGPNLNFPEIQEEMKRRIGFTPKPTYGTHKYLLDVLRQFYGPNGSKISEQNWRYTKSLDENSHIHHC